MSRRGKTGARWSDNRTENTAGWPSDRGMVMKKQFNLCGRFNTGQPGVARPADARRSPLIRVTRL